MLFTFMYWMTAYHSIAVCLSEILLSISILPVPVHIEIRLFILFTG